MALICGGGSCGGGGVGAASSLGKGGNGAKGVAFRIKLFSFSLFFYYA